MAGLTYLIAPEEVKFVLEQYQTSASGPEMLGVRELKALGGPTLSLLYFTWLAAQRTPQWTKFCRTVLVPKCLENSQEVGNWRAITIGSHLLRCYAKILARRLQTRIKTSPLQKAFREVDGCSEHITMLHGMIRDARTRSRSIYVVTLDLVKAFDTVNHELIFRALRWHNAADHFAEVVRDVQVTTRVSSGNAATGKIGIRSRVKQGCSLYPILFAWLWTS